MGKVVSEVLEMASLSAARRNLKPYQVVVLLPPLLPLLFQRGVHLRAMLGDALLEVLHALLKGELEDLVVLREIMKNATLLPINTNIETICRNFKFHF